ncbi:MAG: hypothetical protein ACW99Q_12190 [Candidatus Kariarchaeaceae archaeon]
MTGSNDITLTRALYGVTKTSAKIVFIFFLISAVLISITVNEGDPKLNTYTLNEKVLSFNSDILLLIVNQK